MPVPTITYPKTCTKCGVKYMPILSHCYKTYCLNCSADFLLKVQQEVAYRNILKSMTSSPLKRLVNFLLKKNSQNEIEVLLTLTKSYDDEIRTYALEELEKLDKPEAIKSLIPLLQEKDKKIVYSALTALNNIKDKKALKPLILFIEEEEDKHLLCIAIRALERIKDNRAVVPLIALVEKETKKSLTETDNFQIVHQAIRALGEIKDIKAIKPIVSQIPNKEISQNVISTALKRINDSSSKKLVTKILHHNDVEVIERAKYIIARLEK